MSGSSTARAPLPGTPADGVSVNFAVARPADRRIEGPVSGQAPRLPPGVPGRHSDRGAALRIDLRGDARAARHQHGLFHLRRERIRG